MDMPFWKTFWKAVVPLDSTVDGAGPGQISRSTRGWMAAMTGLEAMDRLLVETDSPYLAPVPYRGKENQPAYTREVCEYVATLKGVSTEEFARITTQNFERLFKIRVE